MVLHALATETDLQRALAARLGQRLGRAKQHPDLASLGGCSGARSLGAGGDRARPSGAARVLPLTDSCGFPLLPTPLAVKAEDYPLTLPIFLLTPRRRLPLFAREFLEFLALPAAQDGRGGAGFIDRRPRAPTDDGGWPAADQRHSGCGRGNHAGRSEAAGRSDGRGGPAVADLPV